MRYDSRFPSSYAVCKECRPLNMKLWSIRRILVLRRMTPNYPGNSTDSGGIDHRILVSVGPFRILDFYIAAI